MWEMHVEGLTLNPKPLVSLVAREKLRTLVASVYYNNARLFQLKPSFMHAAFLGKCTATIISSVGKGGDGKRMEAVLHRVWIAECF